MPSKAVSFSTLKIIATTKILSIGNVKNKNIRIMIDNNNNDKERQSLPDAITMSSNDSNIIDYNRAKLEHDNYLKALRKYIPVLCLPPLDNMPDSMFVEDTVVTVGHKAVITNPGHPIRRREVDTIRTLLEDQLAMDVTDMREDLSATATTTAYCDGGDVMFTGRHLFVGISGERTSFEAIKILEKGLDVEVIPIPFQQGTNTLHLKSIITHVDEHTLLVPDNNDLGPSHATLSCNVVSVQGKGRGGLLAQLSHEDDHRTRNILTEISQERDLNLEFVSLKEAAKCDGALTCC
eukprot:CAMPEP_0170948954 /NCGR_PEP_ID=MMETSP0735-20130129/28972_1 /TAXON_ID=186038 /ORGANISM="Fragilariopsis kerguelensis, Strain L26-C5" /LENGTH=292 /DNA_ID=CAMNT_0011358895 /DNA_START=158 /DNA_END=1034 /DNA_ORIENTATION=+